MTIKLYDTRLPQPGREAEFLLLLSSDSCCGSNNPGNAMGERGNKFIGRKQTDIEGRLKSGPISESGIGKELFHETFHPFWKSYFSRLAAAASVLGVREEGEEVKPRSRRGYCKFMQSASHTLTLLECTNGSRRIVHSSERVYCIPRPSASRCSACQAHATQFPQEMSVVPAEPVRRSRPALPPQSHNGAKKHFGNFLRGSVPP